ncbi:MAG: glycosyltransferase family 4 protein [Deltaproteobacteria bacterium]|nr:glycosyltransferase family 4 protein [Deltaproteobacteria bacterium]
MPRARRLVFICPDLPFPVGGTKVLYRHIDILRDANIDAIALHTARGFRYRWFDNSTPTISRFEFRKRDSDIFVIPEVFGPKLANLYGNAPKVIFNQNSYYTFWHYPPDGSPGPCAYTDPSVVGAVVVSQDSKHYLESVFPQLPVARVTLSVNPHIFMFSKRKERQIAFMPRKNERDAQQVLNILRHKGVLRGWKVATIDQMTEKEVAATMRKSLVFLSFGHPEGFPLPPLEAMASGCLCVGYHGNGGREYFKRRYAYPVEVGDIQTFAWSLERILTKYSSRQAHYERIRRRAAKYISETFSPANERKSVVATWRQIISRVQ